MHVDSLRVKVCVRAHVRQNQNVRARFPNVRSLRSSRDRPTGSWVAAEIGSAPDHHLRSTCELRRIILPRADRNGTIQNARFYCIYLYFDQDDCISDERLLIR